MGKSSSSSSSEVGRKNCYRGHWRPAEDEKLRELVERYGPQNWNFIAEHLYGRSGKSCRLRWYNQLDPNINKKPFNEEEEEKLLSAHRIYGNKWACIAKYFSGRTDNAVKNHYHVVMARRKRERFTAHSSSSSPSSYPPKLGFPKLHRKIEMLSLPSSSGDLNGNDGRMSFASRETLNRYNAVKSGWVSSSDDRRAITSSDENLVRSVKFLGVADSVVKEQKDVAFIDFLGVGIISS